MNPKENETEQNNFYAEVVLVEPEIPQNTGNIARTCAALGCRLHLIKPLGFLLSDRYLRRAGMDYWADVEYQVHNNFKDFFNFHPDGRYLFFTRNGKKNFYDTDLNSKGKIYLVFGKESTGLPESLVTVFEENCCRLPMRPGVRSLNLASTVNTVLYEAFRQNNFPGLV